MSPSKDTLSNLSVHLKNVVAHSIQHAATLRHQEVTPLHFLLSVLEESGSKGAALLEEHGFKKGTVEQILVMKTGSQDQTDDSPLTLPELSPTARASLEKSMVLAYTLGHTFVGTEHLISGVLESNDEEVENIIQTQNIQKKSLVGHIHHFLVAAETEKSSAPNKKELIKTKVKKIPEREVTALEVFTINLTAKKAQKNIDPVIGRTFEIERLIDILGRRTKNNPVLVGEPGVGKTAIVEGLAKRIAEGQVPAFLKDKKILSLDLALLVSGTIYRGEFEARLKQIIDELAEAKDCILFIDELHNIIGVGGNQGAMDAANILKPALARGAARCIGATTHDEYKKYIAADGALERRFQSIVVEEPNRQETIAIMSGIKQNYEEFHGVDIAPEAIEAAVDLSIKYVHDNFLPDKAIDVLDEGAAAVKVRHSLGGQKKRKAHKRPLVQRADMAGVIHRRFQIPEQVLLENEWSGLQRLEKTLKQEILGQDRVIETLVGTLRRSLLNIKNSKKPMASFLFAGPSGVGKTALGKILARELFQNEQALIKLDMSEFAEAHGISKLLGSPAGYVGYKERNHFTEKIRQRPFCVVLFDEIDKAHPDVVRLLFQILDEGELTDSAGKKVNFKNTLILLTTNIGSEFYKHLGIGFDEKQLAHTEEAHQTIAKAVTSRLKDSLDSSLIARLGGVLTFSPLSQETLEKIVKKRIHTLNQHFLETRALSVQAEALAISTLAKMAFHPDEGARLIEKVIDEEVNNLVIGLLEKNKHAKKKKFVLQEKAGQLRLM